MKNLTKLFICAFAIFATLACSDSSTPSEVVLSMYNDAQAGDYKSAASCVYIVGHDKELSKAEIAELRTRVATQMEVDFKRAVERKGEITSIELMEETIAESGESAKVKVKLVYSKGREEIKTREAVKVKGSWLVDL